MGLTILDVAIGLVLVYLVLSLVGTAITELIAQKAGKRAKVLHDGIKVLLGEQLTEAFYGHRLIRNLAKQSTKPSYIPEATFAETVLDLASTYVPADGVKPASLREGVAAFVSDHAHPKGGSPSAEDKQQEDLGRTLLMFIDESEGDRTRLIKRVEQWFNDSMVRVSGWYRRWAQRTLFWTGVGLAVLLNANTVRMVRVLYDTPVLRETLVAEAKSRVEQAAKPAPETEPTVEKVKSEIATIQPILGWTAADFRPSPSWGTEPSRGAWILLVIESLVGFFVTVLAISMGAPFWFGVLQWLLRLRTQAAGAKGGSSPEAGAAGGAGVGGGAPAPAGTAPPLLATEKTKTFQDSFDPDATRHSHGNAYWLGKLAELAYQDGTGFKTSVAGWGLKCSFVSVGNTQVHVVASDDRMIVAFRGTETNPGDIATDAKFKQVPWKGPGKVHEGFLEALDDAWDDIVRAISTLSNPGQTLWFTGHSLGGALAVLAAMRWMLDGNKPAVSGLYTIGQPRVGDKAFATELANKLGERMFRYINNRDIVPRVPLRAMGYADAGRVLYFDSSGRLHVDPAPWFKLLDVAFLDTAKAKETLKETVGDHSAVGYVELLRRAMP